MIDILTFDEASHTYRAAGKIVPSVTQILAPIKPDFSAVNPAVLEAKRSLGVEVHLACELDDAGDLETCADEICRYLTGWRKFRADTGAEILANERRLYHPVLGFAGTLDRMLVMPDRESWLIDIKTAADPHPSYGVQLAGYKLLVSGAVSPEAAAGLKRGTVHLYDDGTYRLRVYNNPNDEACFRALLSVHQWKEANQ